MLKSFKKFKYLKFFGVFGFGKGNYLVFEFGFCDIQLKPILIFLFISFAEKVKRQPTRRQQDSKRNW